MHNSPLQREAGPVNPDDVEHDSLEQGISVRLHPRYSETEVVVSFVRRYPLLILTTLIAFFVAKAGYLTNYSSGGGSSVPSRVCLPVEDVLMCPIGSSWLRDLCRDGIEPNPGPATLSAVQMRRGKKKNKASMGAIPQSMSKSIAKEAARFVLRPKATSKSLGEKIGGWVGDKAQKAILAITGFGDYKVNSNSLTSGSSPPSFSSGRHCSKFCHREYFGNISGTTAFTVFGNYRINPSNAALFPWLAEIALSFEQFSVRGMVVEFKSTAGDAIASSNNSLGSVIIATQYNVLAPTFTTQQQMEAYEFCTSTKPSVSCIHPIECAPNLVTISELYIDSGSGGDARLENLGITTIATVGQQTTNVIGELWVSYEIDLYKPKIFSGVSSQGLSSHWQASSYPSFASGGGANFPLSGLVNSSLTDLVAPQLGSDITAHVTVTAGSGNVTQLSFSGQLAGTFLFVLVQNLGTNAGSNPVSSSGAVFQLVSGAGQVINPWNSGVVSAGLVNSCGNVTLSALSHYQFTLSAVFSLPGNAQPIVPVVFNVTGLTFTNSTSINAIATDLYVTQISVNT